MTEKRFTLDDEENGVCKCILVDGEEIPTCEVCNILNELYEDNLKLEKENKELKAMCEDYRKLSIQYSQKYNEKISDNTFLEEENTHIKNTIKQAYNNERTTLGKNILKQLMEQIQ